MFIEASSRRDSVPGSTVRGAGRRVVGRSGDLGIVRPADDRGGEGGYGQGVARLRIDLVALDRALAVLLTAALELEVWLGGHPHTVALAVAGPLLTLPVAVRRRYPFVVGTGAGLWGVVASTLFPPDLVSVLVAWCCDMYALAVWTPPRRFVTGLLVYTVPAVAVIPFTSHSRSGAIQFIVISTIVILLVRWGVRGREQRAGIAERERDLAAREAVVEERARIARELHDAIAHNVSMIVVQAGAERRLLDDSQQSTREVLATVEQVGRGALTEMRRLVGMLRSDAGDPLAPQPGLADLPTLVTQVSEAGLPVELSVEGEPRPLPIGIELSAYRIVQEALTNALKHAGDAHASVRVRYGADSLELEIVDDGAGAATASESGGHGLLGMRERVALYGGRLDAGRAPAGGFAVRVLLPVR
jgi:signal transduction histidine kinase